MPDPHAHRPHDFTSLVRTRIGALPVDPMREADLVASGMPDAEALKQALAPLDERDCVAAEIARADRPRSVIARLKPSCHEPEPSRDDSAAARLKPSRCGPAPQPAG